MYKAMDTLTFQHTIHIVIKKGYFVTVYAHFTDHALILDLYYRDVPSTLAIVVIRSSVTHFITDFPLRILGLLFSALYSYSITQFPPFSSCLYPPILQTVSAQHYSCCFLFVFLHFPNILALRCVQFLQCIVGSSDISHSQIRSVCFASPTLSPSIGQLNFLKARG